MANTPPNSSHSQSGLHNPRVARRNTRLPRAGPYPTHFTLPALATKVNQHEQRLRTMDVMLQETNENWRLTSLERINQVSEDHENTINNVEVLHNKVVEIGVEAALLRRRLEECEQRSRETEEYTRGLVQRLALAEDNARQASRLANTVDHLIEMMEQIDLHRD